MGIFDGAVPGGNIAKPIMVAIGALLVGRMLGGGGSPAPSQQPVPQPAGGAAGGGGGLMGGLGGLLDRLTNSGHGDVAKSWVGTGANTPLPPAQLGAALGPATVSDLARQAGMTEQELLDHLSRTLPGVVDKLTPAGRIPPQSEVATAFNPWRTS